MCICRYLYYDVNHNKKCMFLITFIRFISRRISIHMVYNIHSMCIMTTCILTGSRLINSYLIPFQISLNYKLYERPVKCCCQKTIHLKLYIPTILVVNNVSLSPSPTFLLTTIYFERNGISKNNFDIIQRMV